MEAEDQSGSRLLDSEAALIKVHHLIVTERITPSGGVSAWRSSTTASVSACSATVFCYPRFKANASRPDFVAECGHLFRR
jgi:hypothetical protein